MLHGMHLKPQMTSVILCMQVFTALHKWVLKSSKVSILSHFTTCFTTFLISGAKPWRPVEQGGSRGFAEQSTTVWTERTEGDARWLRRLGLLRTVSQVMWWTCSGTLTVIRVLRLALLYIIHTVTCFQTLFLSDHDSLPFKLGSQMYIYPWSCLSVNLKKITVRYL